MIEGEEPSSRQRSETMSYYLLLTYFSTVVTVALWRVWRGFSEYIRTVTSLHDNTQRYFAAPDWKLSFLKKHVLYAPSFSKRKNRELYLASVNIGTLPSRLQLFFLVGCVAANVTLCVIDIPFSSSYTESASQLRERSGLFAVVNLVPLFLVAGRNNPLIKLLKIPFDTFNLFHRWLGRIIFFEVFTHTIAHLAAGAYASSWGASFQATLSADYLVYGFIGTCAFAAINLQSPRAIRSTFYETFKLLHIFFIATAVLGTWYHLRLKSLPQTNYLTIAIFLWIFDYALRVTRVIYHSIGKGGAMAVVGVLPDDTCCVTISTARPWIPRPGQHAYIYMPSIGFWQSHPFSVAWSEEVDGSATRKEITSYFDDAGPRRNTITFIIRAKSGFTKILNQKAAASNGTFDVACLAEGPYGALYDMRSYGTVVLFAGGVGITHQLLYVKDLVMGFVNKTVATKKIILIWSIRGSDHFEWVRPWMEEIVAMDGSEDVLRVMIFVTQPPPNERYNRYRSIRVYAGRPKSDTLLGSLMKTKVGAVGVSVCGPGELADDVRQAVRKNQYDGIVDYIEESFSW